MLSLSPLQTYMVRSISQEEIYHSRQFGAIVLRDSLRVSTSILDCSSNQDGAHHSVLRDWFKHLFFLTQIFALYIQYDGIS